MNRKEIITADLCARLPHGVKMYDGVSPKKLIGIDFNINETRLKLLIERDSSSQVFYTPTLETSLPILFNSITEPMAIKICKFRFDGHEYGYELTDDFLRIWGDDDGDSEEWFWFEEWFNFPEWFVDLLDQWHVNYRLLPGEFVPATNEYA